MVQAFVEKNRKLLQFYYWATRVGGWLFLSLASLAVAGHSVALATRIGDWEEFSRYYLRDVPWALLSNGLPTGLLVLGMSQFIKYLLETEVRPGWILRNGDKLLYAYTAIVISYYCWISASEVISHFGEPYDFPARLILSAIFILVKLLALLGVAQILRRAIPVLDESRTLI
ncbi:MAG: hypothetical protein KAS23_14855 [Anaerohalosphaera sp.]|nr:hypothetical protein [Anaerohalosphaera sp.]